ncbi:MAG TPA: Sbal_3080 family lipoprotein [Burkholderiales bacterium]|jgi:hypothetical protein|nr:Sbal_3080 family lipoprotein [Burkholderiales bacterium]
MPARHPFLPCSSLRSLLLLLPLALGACAIHQNVSPVAAVDSKQICVVVNPKVFNEGFLQSYGQALRAKGFEVKELPPGSGLIDCPVVSTYTANWHWDLAMYMNYAEIKIYSNARPVGEAIYDSRNGSYNMGKFIKADVKINELVNQLFPAGAGGASDAAPLRTSGQAAGAQASEAPR